MSGVSWSASPVLPVNLLPAGWPGRRARAIFADIYDTLAPLAAVRGRRLVAEHEPALAAKVAHRTTQDAPEGAPAETRM